MLRGHFERVLAGGLESGEIEDGTIADSLAQRSALWLLRERVPEAEKRDGGSVKHDVSVRIGRIPEYVARAEPALLVKHFGGSFGAWMHEAAHGRDAPCPVRGGGIDDVQHQVGFRHLLERSAECRHQGVRQPIDEADGIRDQQFALIRQVHLPHERVERDDGLVGMDPGQSLDHVDLGTDRDHRSGGRGGDPLLDAFGGSDPVGEPNDLVRALGVDEQLGVRRVALPALDVGRADVRVVEVEGERAAGHEVDQPEHDDRDDEQEWQRLRGPADGEPGHRTLVPPRGITAWRSPTPRRSRTGPCWSDSP